MKNLKMMVCMWVLAASTVGCSSAYYASGGYVDDMYGTHDQVAIARKRQAKAEAEKAAAEARKAEWEARIAEARAAAAEQEYYANPYDEVLADTYESAYARRLRGFESPTYRLPSSYYNFRYGGAFNYVTAYDPAFYNIVVSGDQVWVEPKYITSMFGAWGGSVVYADPWYWGWNYGPYYRPWNFGLSIGSWGWSLGWNNWYDPWHYGWNSPWWGPGWGPAWAPGHGPGHVHGKPYAPNIVRRPSPYVSPSGGRHYGSRPGNGASSFNRNATRFDFGVRGNAAQPGGRGNATYDRGVGSGGSRGRNPRQRREEQPRRFDHLQPGRRVRPGQFVVRSQRRFGQLVVQPRQLRRFFVRPGQFGQLVQPRRFDRFVRRRFVRGRHARRLVRRQLRRTQCRRPLARFAEASVRGLCGGFGWRRRRRPAARSRGGGSAGRAAGAEICAQVRCGVRRA